MYMAFAFPRRDKSTSLQAHTLMINAIVSQTVQPCRDAIHRVSTNRVSWYIVQHLYAAKKVGIHGAGRELPGGRPSPTAANRLASANT